MPFDKYESVIDGWATSLELVRDYPDEQEDSIEFEIGEYAPFLVVVSTLPNGQRLPWSGSQFYLRGPQYELVYATDDEVAYVDEQGSLAVINNPPSGTWQLTIPQTTTPVAIHLMVFHPRMDANGVPAPPVPPPTPSGPTFKCRACKTTAKALALSIIAAATLPSLPAALVSSVAAFLGVAKVIAAAFIASVIGDAADAIAEALCKKVGLC